MEREEIMKRLQEHYDDALHNFPEDQIVGIFLQGSQNYEMDMPGSDVDSKLVVIPSLDDIVFAKDPVSETFIRANDEHIDFKDIRLMFKTFRKQNINFIEILFTKYYIINPMYKPAWDNLIKYREDIARYDTVYAVKAMQGMAHEKHHAMEHIYPSRQEIIEKNGGYDPKQLHHIQRLEDFLERYINGEKYENCLIPLKKEYLKAVKSGVYHLEGARRVAEESLKHIDEMANQYKEKHKDDEPNSFVDILLNETQGIIIKAYITKKIKEDR